MNNFTKGEWLPSVGDEVEVWANNVGYLGKVKVIAVDGNKIVWRNGGDGMSYIGTDIEFVRPIQSEHDRLRNELLEIIESNGNLSNGVLADSIIKAGWRPPKGARR